MIDNLYAKYLLADRLNKIADRAGVTIALVQFGIYADVHAQVQGLDGYGAEARERAAVALLDVMPELRLVREEGLIYLRGTAANGLTFQFYAGTGVCERVQTGTRTVKRPDPEYLAAAPMVEVEEPVFEVRCPEPEAVLA